MTSEIFLKENDCIGLISPSGKIVEDKIIRAKKQLSQAGYRVKEGVFLKSSYHKFAGTDIERATDFNQMIADQEVKAILCTRGGYGAIRIIDKIDVESLIQNPKMVIGLSDITVFHIFMNNLGIPSLHALMPNSFPVVHEENSTGLNSLINLMKGNFPGYHLKGNSFNMIGLTEGVITGGNLSLIYALQGTPYQINTKNKILFIEEVSEYYYHIDRMIQSLKLAGIFEEISGLIVGNFTDCKEDNFGISIEEMILQAIGTRKIPVCFDFPAGHIDQTLALPFGMPCKFEVDEKSVKLNLL